MDGDKNVGMIDFYICSRGGSQEAPWPISMLREYCENLNVLDPILCSASCTKHLFRYAHIDA